MPEKDNKDYIVDFRGARLNKRTANVAGMSIICGLIAAVFVALLNYGKLFAYILILIFAVLGYFIGIKVFVKDKGKGTN